MSNPVINPRVRDRINPKNNLHNVKAVPLIKVKSNNNSVGTPIFQGHPVTLFSLA
ncbi:MAG: hypothetical protein ACXWE0_11135 [Nitrososphaeraceae archaeon]